MASPRVEYIHTHSLPLQHTKMPEWGRNARMEAINIICDRKRIEGCTVALFALFFIPTAIHFFPGKGPTHAESISASIALVASPINPLPSPSAPDPKAPPSPSALAP